MHKGCTKGAPATAPDPNPNPNPNPLKTTTTTGGGGGFSVFLEQCTEHIKKELSGREADLKKDLGDASEEQSQAAGRALATCVKNGNVTTSIIGLARNLCRAAAKNKITKSNLEIESEKIQVRNDHEKLAFQLINNKYTGAVSAGSAPRMFTFLKDAGGQILIEKVEKNEEGKNIVVAKIRALSAALREFC